MAEKPVLIVAGPTQFPALATMHFEFVPPNWVVPEEFWFDPGDKSPFPNGVPFIEYAWREAGEFEARCRIRGHSMIDGSMYDEWSLPVTLTITGEYLPPPEQDNTLLVVGLLVALGVGAAVLYKQKHP